MHLNYSSSVRRETHKTSDLGRVRKSSANKISAKNSFWKPFLCFYIYSFCSLMKCLRNCTKTKVYILENSKIFNNFRLILNFLLTRLGAHWIINMWEVPSFYLFIALSLYLYLPVLFICYHLPILFCSTFDR